MSYFPILTGGRANFANLFPGALLPPSSIIVVDSELVFPFVFPQSTTTEIPIAGSKAPSETNIPYFKSLDELDEWATNRRNEPIERGLVPYVPRPLREMEEGGKGKLLVCHDYKGGYTESPFALSYTFNFWSLCDTFVYFAHHRVTVPPPGWVNAAHRQGVKMLGTLIFENESEPDALRLIIGKMPSNSNSNAAEPSVLPRTLPVSAYYARLLADLAAQRGFDGYLLNFEVPLRGAVEQTRALSAWITILQGELRKRVGPHAEAIWYDSMVFNGQLAWQDRLNSLNLPFFISSTGLFTNYTWRPHYPNLTKEYFTTLSPQLTSSSPFVHSKSLSDIYVGIDVWGRGQHGGGGLGSYRSLEHIDPTNLGLSVALFGHAWTWESEQDKEGWGWDSCWEYESTLWVGAAQGKEVKVPEAPRRNGEAECPHGAFRPVGDFFERRGAPDPYEMVLMTSFCPGVGRAWLVNGAKVHDAPVGWTDIDKQTSVGDLVFPHPSIQWEDSERSEPLPSAVPNIVFDDAWIGGSALSVSLQDAGSEEETNAYRCFWVPVQSVNVTPGKGYEAALVYKLPRVAEELDVDLALSAPPLSREGELEVEPGDVKTLEHGWTKFTLSFTPPQGVTQIALGVLVTIVTESPTPPLDLPILFGLLTCSPHIPPSLNLETKQESLLLWADFDSSTHTLSWEPAACLPSVQSIPVTSVEDKAVAWCLQPSAERWWDAVEYENIYVAPFKGFEVGKGEDAVWVGTSGAGRRAFDIVPENLGLGAEVGEGKNVEGQADKKKVRIYVQGVSRKGEVMRWRHCVYVDVEI